VAETPTAFGDLAAAADLELQVCDTVVFLSNKEDMYAVAMDSDYIYLCEQDEQRAEGVRWIKCGRSLQGHTPGKGPGSPFVVT